MITLKPKNNGKPWEQIHINRIKYLWNLGETIGNIAKEVERLPSAVFMKLHNECILDYYDYGYTNKYDIFGNDSKESKVAQIKLINVKSKRYNEHFYENPCNEIILDENSHDFKLKTIKGEWEMSNQRKVVKARFICDDPRINNSDAVVFESNEIVVTDSDLTNIRDEFLVDEGKEIKKTINILNEQYGLDGVDDETKPFTIHNLRFVIKEV